MAAALPGGTRPLASSADLQRLIGYAGRVPRVWLAPAVTCISNRQGSICTAWQQPCQEARGLWRNQLQRLIRCPPPQHSTACPCAGDSTVLCLSLHLSGS